MTTATETKPEALTKKQLADKYKVHPKTLKRWLQPFTEKIGNPHNLSRVYTPAQVAQIFQCLGEP